MARIARVVVPHVPHHVTQRGNRRQVVFFSDDDYRTYLAHLSKSLKKTQAEVWAYCLMPNHVHLILVPNSEDGLRATLAETHRRYTRHINFREDWRGHLWQERFHSFPMDESYLYSAVRYVELNPVRAGFCERPDQWPWSSAVVHLTGKSDGLVEVKPMLKMVSDWAEYLTIEDHDSYKRLRKHQRSGRPLGGDTFVDRVERVVGRQLRPLKPGPKRVSDS